MTFEECKDSAIERLKIYNSNRYVYVLLGQNHLPRYRLEFFKYIFLDKNKPSRLLYDCSEFVFSKVDNQFVYNQEIEIDEDGVSFNCSNVVLYSDKWIDITDPNDNDNLTMKHSDFENQIFNDFNTCYTNIEKKIYEDDSTFTFSEITEKIL